MLTTLSKSELEREIAERDKIEKDLTLKEKRLKGIEETVDGFAVYYRFQSLLAECQKERERVIKIQCKEMNSDFNEVKDFYIFRIEYLITSFSEVENVGCHEQAKEILEIIRKYNKLEFELEDSQLLSFAVSRNNFEDFSKKEKQTIRDLEISCREKQNTIIQALQTQLKGENIIEVLEDEEQKKKKTAEAKANAELDKKQPLVWTGLIAIVVISSFLLASWYWQFKWWVKLITWLNQPSKKVKKLMKKIAKEEE